MSAASRPGVEEDDPRVFEHWLPIYKRMIKEQLALEAAANTRCDATPG